MIYYIIFSALFFYSVNRIFNIKNIFNPFVFVILMHFLFFYFGLFYKDIYHHIVINNSTVLLVNYSFLFVFIGGILSRYLIQKTNKEYIKFLYVDIKLKINNKTAIVGFLFILFGIFFTIKYIISAGGMVIFMKDIENARIETRKGNGLIVQLALNFFTYGLLTVIMTKSSKYFKGFLILLVSFLVLSFGNRGPLLFLLVFVIYVIQAVNKIQFSLKKVTIYGLMLFSLMVLFGSLRTNYDADFLALFKARFAWRPFVNIQNFQLVLDYFPKKHDFLLGETYLKDIEMLLPGSHPNSGTFLKDLMQLKFDGGSITPSYLGISYINFGLYGLFFSPILLGFLSNTFYEVYIRRFNMNNPSSLIFLLLVSFNFASIVSSGVMTVLIQNMTVLLLVHFFYIGLIKLLYRIK